MNEDEAGDVVLQHLHAAWPSGYEAAVVRVEDAGADWRVFYNSKAFMETGAISDALAGNWPYLVDKASGSLRTDEAHRRQVLGLPPDGG